jgi:hypothetical protein
MPSAEISYTFTNNTLAEVTKAAAVIGAPDMVLEAMDQGSAIIKVTDKKNVTANDYKVHVDITDQQENVPYKFWFKVENLKIIPGSYSVGVSSKNISHFKNNKVNVEYFIALEPESSYNH